MARTPEIEISVDPIHPRPDWMSSADYCMLLDRFGMEVSRVTCYTYFPENSIHPSDLAYQCVDAWEDRWTTQYDDWLYYGSYLDDDYVDESEWKRELAQYLEGDLPNQEEPHEGLADWELDLLGLKPKCNPELSWLDAEPVAISRYSHTRRYGRTAKQWSRDGSTRCRDSLKRGKPDKWERKAVAKAEARDTQRCFAEGSTPEAEPAQKRRIVRGTAPTVHYSSETPRDSWFIQPTKCGCGEATCRCANRPVRVVYLAA